MCEAECIFGRESAQSRWQDVHMHLDWITTGRPITNHPRVIQLYALFKVANGEDISKTTAPGMFDLKVRVARSSALPALRIRTGILSSEPSFSHPFIGGASS
jgi:hypothetical protein